MGFWTVLGGVATGVAVVVALPVAGPIGAITAVGAAVAGTVGAAGGAAISALDESEEQAEKRGEERATAKHYAKMEDLRRKFQEMKDAADGWRHFGNNLVALTAVGIACANCDGEIHPDERTDIDEFIAGISHSELPIEVKEKIGRLWQTPPNLRTAFQIAEKYNVDFSLLDDIIDMVMHADGRVHAKEKAFMNAWDEMRNSKVA